MQLPRSQQLAAQLIWLDETPSTNTALRELVEEHPDQANRTVLATASQTAGRGRLGREWIAPPGKTLAMSAVLRRHDHALPASWLPLIAGSAVRRGIARVLAQADIDDVALGVKWPNDVLARRSGEPADSARKLSGILTEMLPDESVIVGIGINTQLALDELPTPTSTSLAVLGLPDSETDTVLSAVLTEFFALLDALADGQVDTVRDAVTADSSTLGTQVRAHLPNGEHVQGQALSLAEDGALVIASAADGSERTVAAGDIEHLR